MASLHDAYLPSLLVIAGLSLGLSIQGTIVGLSAASAATARHLSRLALIESGFCVGFYLFVTARAAAPLRWYCLAVVAPLALLPRVLGDLVMHLTAEPDRWMGARRFATHVAWVGFTGMVLDAALSAHVLYSDIEAFGAPFNTRFPSATSGGFVFLTCWGGLVFAFMGRLLIHARREQGERPLLYGLGGFGVVLLVDLGTVASGTGFYMLQHLGFLSLLLGAWAVLAKQNRAAAERLRMSLERLEEQRHQLLHEGPRIQQQKLESLGTLAACVAHEVLNPSTSIMNYARLLRQRNKGEPAIDSIAGEVLDECNRVTAIVRSLLTFARREDLIRLPERAREMVEETCRLIEQSLAEDGIRLEVNGSAEGVYAKCTRQQIQQVLLNLLQNAQHALNVACPGSDVNKRIRVTVRQAARAPDLAIQIDVEHWGTGISEDDLPRIFDPFFTNRPDHSGTGLGLAVSHGIVVDHGGSLSVESSPGHTRFRVVLPAVAAEHTTSLGRARTPEKAPPSAQGSPG